MAAMAATIATTPISSLASSALVSPSSWIISMPISLLRCATSGRIRNIATDADHRELQQAAHELRQRAHGEHALQPGERRDLVQLGHEAIGRPDQAELQVARADRGDAGRATSGTAPGHQQDAQQLPAELDQMPEVGRHQVRRFDEGHGRLVDRARRRPAEQQDREREHAEHQQVVDFAGVGDLTAVARFVKSPAGRVFGFLGVVLLFRHGSPAAEEHRHPFLVGGQEEQHHAGQRHRHQRRSRPGAATASR